MVKSRVEADSPVDQRVGLATAGMATPACDFCGAACPRSQRRRLTWETEAGDELVLADLCARCAAHADRLLDVYGGRGRASMRLTSPGTADVVPLALVRRHGRAHARSGLRTDRLGGLLRRDADHLARLKQRRFVYALGLPKASRSPRRRRHRRSSRTDESLRRTRVTAQQHRWTNVQDQDQATEGR